MLQSKGVEWLTTRIRPRSAPDKRGLTTFRWTLPFTQLVVCAVVFWSLHGEFTSHVEFFRDYWLGQEQGMEGFTGEERQQEEVRKAQLCMSLGLNAPFLFFLSLSSRVHSPGVLDFMICPIAGMLFWSMAGRGVDAMLAIRNKRVFPRIGRIETTLAALWVVFGTWLGIAMLMGQDDNDLCSSVLGIGCILWAVLAGVIIAAWLHQRRIRGMPVVHAIDLKLE